ncbi:universal stress protein [Polaribacter sp. Q13]|uniref:universal stress protein n=1 Tax=Polaribacter sp. Q13 TaxID=2806551 RepID=UPI00193B9CBE|nr:universal stress protein [Polaribacter sp. Q13]QVY64454.1 universal stress protein [Polaribacter sp. Q13]
MKNILLPTDFSDNAWNAIKYAIQLFKDEKCNFFIMNTYTPIIYDVEYMNPGVDRFNLIDVVRNTSEKGVDKLQKKIESQFKNPNHTYHKISSFNTLTSEIEELHDKHVMDLIVMGTKGATGLSEILFGSNTVHIIKNAKCPVLAIPSNFAFEAPDEILFPSDYEVSFNKKQVKQIVDIAVSNTAKVNILNTTYGDDLSKNQEENKQKLDELFKNVTHIFHSVSNQSVTGAISEFQLKMRINLLVMINNKHSFFENLFFKSTISQIGFHLNVPFLVIPSGKKKH